MIRRPTPRPTFSPHRAPRLSGRAAARMAAAALMCMLPLSCLLPLRPAMAQASNQGVPPHAWLFGTWTGGFFPAGSNISREACLAHPVVIFTQDLVLRATLTDLVLTEREIETVRAVPGGAEFRFLGNSTTQSVLGGAPGPVGFGCENADVLHVQRRSENEITFPGCADFPDPLVRCK